MVNTKAVLDPGLEEKLLPTQDAGDSNTITVH